MCRSVDDAAKRVLRLPFVRWQRRR
jgi:hypothetical protein